MSIWSDIQDRSSGEQVRGKDDFNEIVKILTEDSKKNNSKY